MWHLVCSWPLSVRRRHLLQTEGGSLLFLVLISTSEGHVCDLCLCVFLLLQIQQMYFCLAAIYLDTQKTCLSCHGVDGTTNPDMKFIVKPRKLAESILTQEQSQKIIKFAETQNNNIMDVVAPHSCRGFYPPIHTLLKY